MNRRLTYCDLDFIDYKEAWDLQYYLHQQRAENNISDLLLLLEHPNTYTLGKTAHIENLIGGKDFLERNKISVYNIDRGGDITYHGPGQIVGYPIINLTDWHQDSHKYLRTLEEVIIKVCNEYGLTAGRVDGYTGVWIDDKKIAAIGIKISRWVTMHGFAFNVNTNLDLFDGIIPCGISDKSVTSLQKELEKEIPIDEVKEKLLHHFMNEFNYNTIEFISKKSLLNPTLKN
ncbi:MAG: lipoyl(octanoyl) transferase LipB [Ignavibacterium album]|uniref:lipoyl(octanoyl) transferase LipB n=1 Tax=Ignavibacterium album TaxID=591197 RepID=UPI0026EBDEDD|nr:lipoyl(octanoyl) transferase LipB [Ignavibacterium album]MBI5660969.1 lipoyl(octanoyl) transferase LipB [Ignavibacterium album]